MGRRGFFSAKGVLDGEDREDREDREGRKSERKVRREGYRSRLGRVARSSRQGGCDLVEAWRNREVAREAPQASSVVAAGRRARLRACARQARRGAELGGG